MKSDQEKLIINIAYQFAIRTKLDSCDVPDMAAKKPYERSKFCDVPNGSKIGLRTYTVFSFVNYLMIAKLDYDSIIILVIINLQSLKRYLPMYTHTSLQTPTGNSLIQVHDMRAHSSYVIGPVDLKNRSYNDVYIDSKALFHKTSSCKASSDSSFHIRMMNLLIPSSSTRKA